MDRPRNLPIRAAADPRYFFWTILLLGVILAVKLGVLAALGPTFFNDTSAYLSLGDAILEGTRWLHDGGWGSDPTPIPLLRPYGYPLLVALAKLVSSAHFATILVAFQCLVSVASIVLVSHALVGVIASPAIRYAVLVLIAFSGSSLFDIALLSDGVYASIFVAITFVIAMDMVGLFRITPAWLLAFGFLWGYSTWVRDVGVYFTVFPLLGLLITGRLRKQDMRAILGAFALFLAPVAVMVALYIAWNVHRTGHVFLSITGSINWLWPSFNIRALGLADPFDTNDIVASIVHSHKIVQDLSGIYQVVEILWHEYKLDPLQIQQVTADHFRSVLAHHPLAYLASVAHNVRFERLADYLLNPLANFNDFLQLGPVVRHRVVPGMREVRQILLHPHGMGNVVIALVVSAFTAIALAGLTVTLILTPILCRLRWRADKDRSAVAVAYLWFTFIGLVGAYALVHLEMRLALPVVPAALTCFGYCIDCTRPAWSRYIKWHHAMMGFAGPTKKRNRSHRPTMG